MKKSLLVGLMVVMASLLSSCSEREKIAIVEAKGGYEVIIYADNTWEYQRPFFCELWLNGEKLNGATYFDSSDAATYQVIYANDSSAFKVISKETGVVALIDPSSGEVWPWVRDDENYTEKHERKEKLEALFK